MTILTHLFDNSIDESEVFQNFHCVTIICLRKFRRLGASPNIKKHMSFNLCANRSQDSNPGPPHWPNLERTVQKHQHKIPIELQTRNTSSAGISSIKAIPRLQRTKHPQPSRGPLAPRHPCLKTNFQRELWK